MRARWRVALDCSRDEALLAVELHNQPRRERRLEGFYVHMHLAWLYLLQAEFHRAGVDFRYRLPNGRFERVDGEPKAWDLLRCVKERFPNEGDPVRKNLEFTIGLRNKIEHRYQGEIAAATQGLAQALVINYERELISAFGERHSLGDSLRFPVFVGAILGAGGAQRGCLDDALPDRARNFVAEFRAGLDAEVAQDQRFEFRVYLVPKLAPRSEADEALTFVRETDLTDEQRAALEALGSTGSVIVREQVRSVVGADLLRPGQVVGQVQDRIPFAFNMSHFVFAWKGLRCRPNGADAHPERTDERYCIYDAAHGDYLYKQAFVEKIVRECRTAEGFVSLLGRPPVPSTLETAAQAS
jgi:hypothetical protein